jgi:hypothetical protein
LAVNFARVWASRKAALKARPAAPVHGHGGHFSKKTKPVPAQQASAKAIHASDLLFYRFLAAGFS